MRIRSKRNKLHFLHEFVVHHSLKHLRCLLFCCCLLFFMYFSNTVHSLPINLHPRFPNLLRLQLDLLPLEWNLLSLLRLYQLLLELHQRLFMHFLRHHIQPLFSDFLYL
jgi:hypothetical protein